MTTMTPERWQRMKGVLYEALELPTEKRAEFLDRVCSGEDSLRQEVESFLVLGDKEARTSFLQSSTTHLTLPPGTRLGEYEVQSLIGVGGMGEVYRARDPRLGRDVAVKVLPLAFINNPDRLRRFDQEARAAAALNHPNILAIYDIGTTGQTIPYVVSELLEGETLRECLRRGPLPVRKTVDLTLQITSGLSAAHDKGIIHRDLKPENLFVTKEGRIKILDFGLAKAIRGLGSSPLDSGTLTAQTDVGVIMGTVGYMPPEQIRGLTVDQRSDIFAVGAIVYEMLYGRRAFHGDTAADTMNAILRDDPPPLSETNPALSPALERIVRRCLEKNPNERFHSVRDVAFALEAITAPTSQATGPAAAVAKPLAVTFRAWRPKATALVLLVPIGIAVGVLSFWLHREARTTQTVAEIQALTDAGNVFGLAVASSADGRYVAYVAKSADRGGLQYEMRLLQVATNQDVSIIPRDPNLIEAICFSPDGNFIYFMRPMDSASRLQGTIERIFRIATFGGPATLVVNDARLWGFTLSPDGSQIAYLGETKTESQIITARIDGTNRRVLATRSATNPFWYPSWSPSGDEIAATIARSKMDLVSISVRDGSAREVSNNWTDAGQPAWSSDGSTIFLPARKLGDHVTQVWSIDARSGAAHPVTSGTMSYVQLSSVSTHSNDLFAIVVRYVTSLWIVDSSSHSGVQLPSLEGEGWDSVAWVGERLATANTGPISLHMQNGGSPIKLTSYSDTHSQIARCGPSHLVFLAADPKRLAHIGYFDLQTGAAIPITEGENDDWPSCNADGSIIAFAHCGENNECYLSAKPGPSGLPSRIVSADPRVASGYDQDRMRPMVSPDGKSILVVQKPDSAKPLEWAATVPISGGQFSPISMPVPMGSVTSSLRWSADGKSILYVRNKNGADNVWSYPLAGGQPRPVTDFDVDRIFTFDMAPDGKLLVTRGRVDENIALIRNAR